MKSTNLKPTETTMTLDEAIDLFLLQLDADGRSSHTTRQYARHLRELQRWLEETPEAGLGDAVEDIGHSVIARFFASPKTKTAATGGPRKATSLNALRTSIRCFFSYLHEAGLVAQNPARLLRRAIAPPAAPRALSDPEVERLLAALEDAEPRDRMLFRLMLKTGVRISTAIALKELSASYANGQIGVTTVGDVRRAGGDVIPTSGRTPTHATVTGLSPEHGSKLLTPSIPNPNKVK